MMQKSNVVLPVCSDESKAKCEMGKIDKTPEESCNKVKKDP